MTKFHFFELKQIDKVFNSSGTDLLTSGSDSKENEMSSKQKKVCFTLFWNLVTPICLIQGWYSCIKRVCVNIYNI